MPTIIPAVSSNAAPRTNRRLWALAGAVLFALSLAYFLFAYTVAFGEPAPRPASSPGRDAAWNAVLFLLFAVHHSAFARPAIRAAVARLVPADLERTAFVIVASGLFGAVCALWRGLPGYLWQVDPPAAWLFRTMLTSGVVLTVWSASIVGIRNLAGLEAAATGPAEFKVTGPYGWVRHPIYAGWFLIVFGMADMTATRFEFAVASSLYLLVAMPWEERSLLRHSAGQAYGAYCDRVRWRVVPGLY